MECFKKTGVNVDLTNDQNTGQDHKSKKRCSSCPRHLDRKTDKVCSRCDAAICQAHRIEFFMCRECFNSIHNDNKAYQLEKSGFSEKNLRSKTKK